VGRAGSLYAYLGAKSRKFKVDMIYTLPHLAQHEMGIDRFLRIFKDSGPKADKRRFFNNTYSPEPKVGDTNKSLSLAAEKDFLNRIDEKSNMVDKHYHMTQGKSLFDIMSKASASDLHDIYRNYMEGPGPTISDESKFVDLLTDPSVSDGFMDFVVDVMGTHESEFREMHNAIDTLLFFIAVLRTSVTNNATDPMIGPPLLRLSFGSMYQNVPCLCKDYNISWEEDGGYDLETLTPRNLNIKLSLEEVRVGDFGEYVPAKFVKNDNLTGWESAINSPYTTDPLPVEGYWVDT
jgi:hypothetical protein